MIIRQALNFGVHLAAGIVVGALAVCAASACLGMLKDKRRRDAEPETVAEPTYPGEPEPA